MGAPTGRVPEWALVHQPAHAQAIIEDWRREYNDERPQNELGADADRLRSAIEEPVGHGERAAEF